MSIGAPTITAAGLKCCGGGALAGNDNGGVRSPGGNWGGFGYGANG
jgi:hypothetical protein